MKKPNIENLQVGMKFKSFKQLVIFTGMATEQTYQRGGTNIKNYKDRLHKVGVRYEHIKQGEVEKRALIITAVE